MFRPDVGQDPVRAKLKWMQNATGPAVWRITKCPTSELVMLVVFEDQAHMKYGPNPGRPEFSSFKTGPVAEKSMRQPAGFSLE
jgi:hypothetical protein